MGRPTLTIVWNWNKKKKQSKKYPVYIRVTYRRKSEYLNLANDGIPNLLKEEISTTFQAHKSSSWVRGRNDAFELNQKIKHVMDRLEIFITEQIRSEEPLTLKAIKNNYMGKSLSKPSFNEYVQKYIDESPELNIRAENTKKVYRTFLKKLNEYKPVWPIDQVNYKTVKLFIQWLRYDESQKLKIGTIDKYTDKLRKIYQQASLEGICPVQEHLTHGLKEIRQIDGDEDQTGESLTKEEIQKWINVDLKGIRAHHRDIFLICINLACYYNDLEVMKTKEIYQDKDESGQMFTAIATKRFKKTKGKFQPIHARLSERTLKILFRIHRVKSVDSLIKLDRQLVPDMISDQKYREHLKKIAEAAGISKNVTTRVSKYTGRDLLEEMNTGSLVKHTTGHTHELQSSRYSRKEGKEAMKVIKPVDF
jgi:hypothetical protein